MPAPCGGCPPCCNNCVFDQGAQDAVIAQIIVTAEDYGCAKGYGEIVTTEDGRLGQMRGGSFHPTTPEGAAFLHASDNALAAHLPWEENKAG